MKTNIEEESESFVKGALCYFPFICGLISIFFLLTERKDKFVRFHALQSIILVGLVTMVAIILGIIGIFINLVPGIGSRTAAILIYNVILFVLLGGFGLSVITMDKAYSGERFKIPAIGDLAEKNV
jgi:uncharacterized membrane protein